MGHMSVSQLRQALDRAYSQLEYAEDSHDRELLVAFIDKYESELQHREGE